MERMPPCRDRHGGRDHIWVVTHDEASCWVPAAIRPSIILSHWGRKDKEHESNTGYSADWYSGEMQHPQVRAGATGWLVLQAALHSVLHGAALLLVQQAVSPPLRQALVRSWWQQAGCTLAGPIGQLHHSCTTAAPQLRHSCTTAGTVGKLHQPPVNAGPAAVQAACQLGSATNTQPPLCWLPAS